MKPLLLILDDWEGRIAASSAWERPGSKKDGQQFVPRLDLADLLSSSDIVSIHLRLSPESNHLMNSVRLSQMKRGAILINTSRGAIIDEPALIDALQQGRLSGAGLDVFEKEPLPSDSPLRSLPNVLLTPHIGWTVDEVFEEFARIAAIQLGEYMQGKLANSEIYAT